MRVPAERVLLRPNLLVIMAVGAEAEAEHGTNPEQLFARHPDREAVGEGVANHRDDIGAVIEGHPDVDEDEPNRCREEIPPDGDAGKGKGTEGGGGEPRLATRGKQGNGKQHAGIDQRSRLLNAIQRHGSNARLRTAAALFGSRSGQECRPS